MEFKYNTIHWAPPDQGDTIYEVQFDEELTVEEFLNYIIDKKTDEYGYIRINCIQHTAGKGKVLCEYKLGRYGNVIDTNQQLFDEFSDKPVKSIEAQGSYFQMNYVIFTEDKEMVELREQIKSLEDDLSMANDNIRGLRKIVEEKDAEIKRLTRGNNSSNFEAKPLETEDNSADNERNLDLRKFADREIEKHINSFTYTDLVVLILSLLFMFAYYMYIFLFCESNNNILLDILLAIIGPVLSVILAGIMTGIIDCFKYYTTRLRRKKKEQ